MSLLVPNSAPSGNAEIFANVLSDWPQNGGVPLTNEVKAGVIIQ